MQKDITNRKGGRPKLLREPERFTFTLDPEHIDTIDAVANGGTMSRAEAVRKIIDAYEVDNDN